MARKTIVSGGSLSEDGANSITFGGPFREISVRLRVLGDDLDPDYISKRLGIQPTSALRKVDLLEKRSVPAPTGSWIYDIGEVDGNDFEGAVNLVFDSLPDSDDIWSELSAKFEVDLFCGFFLDGSNRMVQFTPDFLMRLADRKITLSCDVYDWGGDEPDDEV